ncbi:hypothetical protein X559_0719 [Paenilisteria newyorkensis]|nr:hypothetical protein X559_0719 [Listeria newyorkensis]
MIFEPIHYQRIEKYDIKKLDICHRLKQGVKEALIFYG